MPRPIVLMAFACAMSLAGCDRVANLLDQVRPGPDFAAHCAQLPPGPVTVVATPIDVTFDDDRSVTELAALFGRSAPNHRTLGLTQATIGHRAATAVNGLIAPGGGRGCFRPSVRIELFMQPVTVFVGSELRNSACQHAAVLAHEMKHVEVYQRHLDEALHELATVLPSALQEDVYDAPDAEAAQRVLQARVGPLLDAFLRRSAEQIAQRQAAIDTAEEYGQVGQACGGL